MTEINEIGATAFMIACFRAQENEHEHRLCNDPYAQWFINDEIKTKAGQFAAVLPESRDMLRYRFCLFDEIVRSQIDNGMRQIVILGSGFDMRPIVFETAGVVFCDIDQPAVLSFKHKVMQGHGVTPGASIPCNYLEVDLSAKLAEAGLDLDQPILFIWEGNTMYLPVELIFDFLNRLCGKLPRFSIAFDYFSSKIIDRTSGNQQVTAATDMFEKLLGVKWLTGFDDLDVFEQRTSLRVSESAGLLDVGKRVAPEAAPSLSELVGLYSYAMLTHGAE